MLSSFVPSLPTRSFSLAALTSGCFDSTAHSGDTSSSSLAREKSLWVQKRGPLTRFLVCKATNEDSLVEGEETADSAGRAKGWGSAAVG